MKYSFLFFFFWLLNTTNSKSQCINDLYLGFGGPNYDMAAAVIADPAGNVFLTGSFVDAIQLGAFSLSTTDSLASFLAKLSPVGDILWAKKIMSGFRPTLLPVLKINASGQLVMGGTCENNNSDFDTLLHPFTHGDIYIAKFNSNSGNLEGFLSTGNHGYSYLNDFDTDPGNNLFVTGSFVGPITFGSFSMVCTGTTNTFVVKFDAALQAGWAMRVTNSLNSGNAGNKIDLDGSGHVYVAGWYGYTCDFGHGFGLSSTSPTNGYLAKFDTTGNIVWVRSSAPGSIYEHQVVVDTASILVVQESPITIINYNQYGDTTLKKTVSNNQYNIIQQIELKDNHLFAMGRFNNSILLDDSIYSIPGFNIFIARFSLSGALDWLRSIHSTNGAAAESFTIDEDRNIYMSGIYSAPDTLSQIHPLPAFGSVDMFFLKLCNGAVPVNDPLNIEAMQVYPVPFSDKLTVLSTSVNGQLSVYNMTGQEIIKEKTGNDKTEILTDHFLPGLYLLRYTYGESSFSRKVIKN